LSFVDGIHRTVNPSNGELNPICHLLALLGPHHILHVSTVRVKGHFNPLNAELNPICDLLALLGAHHILHVSRLRVNVLHNMASDVGTICEWQGGSDQELTALT